MSTDKEMARWRKMKKAALGKKGAEGFVLVTVDAEGEVSWGAHFPPEHIKALLSKVSIIQYDMKQNIKNGYVA